MSGPSLLLALTYLAVLVFAGGVVLRALKYAQAPMHLRWELYPVPHEKGRSAYGGSYFEEVDWWTRARETDFVGEVRAMLEEMLLIRSLWHHNRPQWYASFPFHFGIYLLFGLIVLLVVGVVGEGPLGTGSPLWSALQGLTVAVGAAGIVLATFGALSLLWRRFTDPNLSRMSAFSDYLNLIVILAAFLSAAFAWLTADNSFALLREYFRSFLTFSPPAAVHPAVATEVILASVFMIYLPFTHMTHFVAKYFTYHTVRWDDAPNLNDPKTLARIQANLSRPVGWSAPHIRPDKSWAETATEVKQ